MIDVIIIGTVALFMYLGYRRGLLRMIFSLISFILAILLASYLFPIVAEWMMETPVYYALKDYIVRTMGLEDMVQAHSGEIITNLPLPDIILNFLYQHNTPNAFEILNVSTIEEYIAAYFARMAINVISLFVVFVVVKFILSLISGLLDLMSRLPVIKQFNKGGGLLIGLALGVIIVWIGLAVMTLFFLDPTNPDLMSMLENSLIAGWVYETNPIMKMLADIL